jgi:hypothetical protein
MRSLTVEIIALSGLGLLTLSGVADAAEPGQADFDVCNKEAYTRAASPSAAPAAGGDVTAKPGTPVSPSAPPTTEPPTSPSAPAGADPGTRPGTPVSPSAETSAPVPGASTAPGALSRGMAAAGQADPAFRHAYLECMKRRGF